MDEKCLRELTDLKAKVTIINEHTEQNKAMLEAIYIKLFGNGREGLITKVTKHDVYFGLIGSAIVILSGCIIKIFI